MLGSQTGPCSRGYLTFGCPVKSGVAKATVVYGPFWGPYRGDPVQGLRNPSRILINPGPSSAHLLGLYGRKSPCRNTRSAVHQRRRRRQGNGFGSTPLSANSRPWLAALRGRISELGANDSVNGFAIFPVGPELQSRLTKSGTATIQQKRGIRNRNEKLLHFAKSEVRFSN